MGDINEPDIFSHSESTLRELSKDTSGIEVVYMTKSLHSAINFDKVKTEYTNLLGLSEECASSVDALMYNGKDAIFIEFKNGNMKNERQKVKTKVRDSLLILCDIMKWDISYTRKNISFILVYNETKNSNVHNFRNVISDHIMQQANTEKIRFGLDGFQTLYFKEVHTYNEEEFEAYLERNATAEVV